MKPETKVLKESVESIHEFTLNPEVKFLARYIEQKLQEIEARIEKLENWSWTEEEIFNLTTEKSPID